MKFSWGLGITFTMIAFAMMMATFMYRAYHAQEELVAENYYEQEIRYQQQIDKLDNVSRLGSSLKMDVIGDDLVISFPEELKGEPISGELYLQRPSDARADARIPFNIGGDNSLHVPVADRLKGVYKVQIEWRAGGKNYLTNERIYVP